MGDNPENYGECLPREMESRPNNAQVTEMASEHDRGDAFTPRWSPETPADVDWILSLQQEDQALLAAIEFRKQAYIENLENQAKEVLKRIRFREWAWRDQIYRIAQEIKGKAQQVNFDHGRIVFRNVGPIRKIISMDQAVEWAEKNAPEIVKVTKKVNKTDLPSDLNEPWIVEESPARTTMNIFVGPIEKKKDDEETADESSS